ncbi:MAG: glycosyltransferase [Burkholderiaceae bacterium]
MTIDPRCSLLFLIPTLNGGGAQRVVATLLHHLDRSKFRMTIAAVDMRDAIFRDDVPADVDVIDLGCTRVRHALVKIVQLIRRLRPDVVFSTLGSMNLALAALRPVLPNGIRYVARETIVVSDSMAEPSSPVWWPWACRRLYPLFDAVVCQSGAMRDDLVENFGLSAAKTAVIHNPVDIERIRVLAGERPQAGWAGRPPRGNKQSGEATFAHEPILNPFDSVTKHPESKCIQLVAAGRLVPQKGFDLLIEALSLCADSRLALTILGKGPLKDGLEQLAKDRGVQQQVRFVGFQRNPYPYLAQADAFVLSSHYEGSPNVVLEALACGTPVVSTPVPAALEILQDLPQCEMAEDFTGEALARALRNLLERPLRRMPADVVDAYAAGAIARQYEQALTHVTAVRY